MKIMDMQIQPTMSIYIRDTCRVSYVLRKDATNLQIKLLLRNANSGKKMLAAFSMLASDRGISPSIATSAVGNRRKKV